MQSTASLCAEAGSCICLTSKCLLSNPLLVIIAISIMISIISMVSMTMMMGYFELQRHILIALLLKNVDPPPPHSLQMIYVDHTPNSQTTLLYF